MVYLDMGLSEYKFALPFSVCLFFDDIEVENEKIYSLEIMFASFYLIVHFKGE